MAVGPVTSQHATLECLHFCCGTNGAQQQAANASGTPTFYWRFRQFGIFTTMTLTFCKVHMFFHRFLLLFKCRLFYLTFYIHIFFFVVSLINFTLIARNLSMGQRINHFGVGCIANLRNLKIICAQFCVNYANWLRNHAALGGSEICCHYAY